MAPSSWITVNGQVTRRPGVFSKIDGSALAGKGPAARGTLAVLLESPFGGEPLTVNTLSNAGVLKRLIPDPLGTPLAKCIFNPSSDPRIPSGATQCKLIRVNPAARASLTRNDAGAGPAMTLYAYDWGVFGNDIQCKLEDGTLASSKKFTAVKGTTTEVRDNIVVNTDVLNFEHVDSITDASVTAHVTTARVDPLGLLGLLGTSGVLVAQQVRIAASHTWTVLSTDSVAFDGTITFTQAVEIADKDYIVIGINKATGLSATETVTITAGGTTGTTTNAYSAITSIEVQDALPVSTTVLVDWYAFDLVRATYDTIAKVVGKIQTKTAQGFDASVGIGATTFRIADMDADGPNALPAPGTVVGFEAQLYYLITAINQYMTLVTAARVTATGDDIPVNFVLTNLTAGTDGVAANSDWEAGLALLKSEDVSHIVCLTTDQSVAALLKTHLDYMAGAGRNERMGFVGLPTKSNLPDIQSAIVALNNRNIAPWINDVKLYDYTGTATWYGPEYRALMAAAGDCGRSNDYSLTWTNFDVLDIGENPGSGANYWTSQDNAETLLEYGACFDSKDVATGLWRVERDVTSYMTDDNPIFSSIYANGSANLSTKNVRRRVEAMIGHGNFTGTSEDVRQLVLTELQRQVDDREIKAYNPKGVTIIDGGNGFDVDYEAAFTEALLFINQTAHAVRIPTGA